MQLTSNMTLEQSCIFAVVLLLPFVFADINLFEDDLEASSMGKMSSKKKRCEAKILEEFRRINGTGAQVLIGGEICHQGRLVRSLAVVPHGRVGDPIVSEFLR